MPTFQLAQTDIDPLLEGLAIFGTGGGGSPAWGKAILENDFACGRTPRLIDLEEISDDATVVSGGIMGSVKVLEKMGTENVMRHWEERFELLEVHRVMQALLGRPIDHVVPFEVGGLNAPVVLSLGARMGVPVIDGDALGRSAPETQMTSFIGHGIALTPMPLIDFNGNVVVVQSAADPTYPDQLGRWVVTNGGGLGANHHYPMTGRQAKTAVIPNTVSASLALGRAVLRARAQGEDPVQTVARQVGGVLLHSGEITALTEEESMGFYYTTARIQGGGQFADQRADLVIKNETMMLSINGEPKAYFPDLILLLDPGTGRGLMSVELRIGSQVSLVGLPCHPRLREAALSSEGQRAFSPARYGRAREVYRPIESLVPQLAASA
jgi:DUF917 family protein